jgi:tetratricopeptide (TPR) repeat protein
LGFVLARSGEEEANTARIEQAVEAYREALQAYQEVFQKDPYKETPFHELSAVEFRADPEALQAYRAQYYRYWSIEPSITAARKLSVWGERIITNWEWALVQNNLGNALAMLGERERGVERLEEAVAAYRAALAVFEVAQTSYYASGVKGNLERVQALFVERRSGIE